MQPIAKSPLDSLPQLTAALSIFTGANAFNLAPVPVRRVRLYRKNVTSSKHAISTYKRNLYCAG